MSSLRKTGLIVGLILGLVIVLGLSYVIAPKLLEPKHTGSLVKEKLKITTIQKVGEEETNVYVIPWRALNMVDVYIDGYAFKFTVETDLEIGYGDKKYENKLSDVAVDYANLVVYFDRRFSVHVVKPSYMTEIFLKVEISDRAALRPYRFEPPDPIIRFSGGNDMTIIVEWGQPDESTTFNYINLKRMNVTVIDIQGKVYQATFLWEPINKTDVFSTVQKHGKDHTFRYKIETDLETIEGESEHSGRVVDVHFRNRITIHVTAIPQENVDIMIAVLDARHVGFDELTMILKWENP